MSQPIDTRSTPLSTPAKMIPTSRLSDATPEQLYQRLQQVQQEIALAQRNHARWQQQATGSDDGQAAEFCRVQMARHAQALGKLQEGRGIILGFMATAQGHEFVYLH